MLVRIAHATALFYYDEAGSAIQKSVTTRASAILVRVGLWARVVNSDQYLQCCVTMARSEENNSLLAFQIDRIGITMTLLIEAINWTRIRIMQSFTVLETIAHRGTRLPNFPNIRNKSYLNHSSNEKRGGLRAEMASVDNPPLLCWSVEIV